MKKRAPKAAKEIVIRPKVTAAEHKLRHDREPRVDFYVMPPPRIKGLDELWRVADAASDWTHIASLLAHVPSARVGDGGILALLHIDLSECLSLLEQALRTGTLPEMGDFRADSAEDVIGVAQEILEMDARGELSGSSGFNSGDALALLASAREALAGTVGSGSPEARA